MGFPGMKRTGSAGPLCVTVLEDDDQLCDLIVAELDMEGFVSKGCASAAEFWRHIAISHCDIAILDVGLPDESGFTVARDLSRKMVGGVPVGIIILSGHGSDEDRIRGLLQGADMYLVKPLDMGVLMASVGSVARRLGRLRPQSRRAVPGAWCLIDQGWTLRPPSGESITLNAFERCLLMHLASQEGRPVHRHELIGAMAVDDCDFDAHRLEMVIYRLRKKVAAATSSTLPLKAVRGAGYMIGKMVVEPAME